MIAISKFSTFIQHEFKTFILCHEGTLNKVLHVFGLLTLLTGLFYKSIALVIAGAVIQELGHFYQYYKSGLLRHSPLTCLKPQSIFAYPLLLLAIAYVLFF